MSQNYTPEFKKKIVRLHEEEGRTYKSITAEYGVSKASITDRHITSALAVRTLQKALDPQHPAKGGLLLHSDQGGQYTSKRNKIPTESTRYLFLRNNQTCGCAGG